VQQGVLSVADADAAVSYGPGLRWGVMGPSLQWHVGGGAGGIQHFMEHLMGPLTGMMKALGTPDITEDLKRSVAEGVLEQAAGKSVQQLAREENEALVGLLALRAKAAGADQSHAKPENNGARARIFFLDLSGGRVLTAYPDGSGLKTIVNEGRKLPDGLTVDVAAGHIYWTNMGNPKANDGSILRSDLDGGNMTTIVPPGGTFTPKQIVFDRASGKLYWSDREGMRVMRCNKDGSGIETLVRTGRTEVDRLHARNWCVGIAVDAVNGKLYWTQKGGDNAGEGRIFRANIEMPPGDSADWRSDIELLYDNLPEPIDLELDAVNGTLYWTDRGDPPRGNTVNRGPVDPEPRYRAVPEIVFDHLMEGIGLALDLEGGLMFVTDLGGSVYCANLDGSDRRTLLVAQGNLSGIAYVGRNGHNH